MQPPLLVWEGFSYHVDFPVKSCNLARRFDGPHVTASNEMLIGSTLSPADNPGAEKGGRLNNLINSLDIRPDSGPERGAA